MALERTIDDAEADPSASGSDSARTPANDSSAGYPTVPGAVEGRDARSRLRRLVPPLFAGTARRGDADVPPPAARARHKRGTRRARAFRAFGRAVDNLVFLSLTRRIIVLNLAALLVLLTGILYLNQFREGLIEARVQALQTQGDIIAAAIAAEASVDTNAITIDPEVLLKLEAGETARPVADPDDLDFPIRPEQVAPVLRRILPERTRGRLYDIEAQLLLDTRHGYDEGQVLAYPLDPASGAAPRGWIERARGVVDRLIGGRYPLYREEPGGSGDVYAEVRMALSGGRPATNLYRTTGGSTVVSVAVPIQRFRATLGVLLLTTDGTGIDATLSAERTAILRVFAVALIVMIVLSAVLSLQISRPLRELSQAATRVRSGGVEGREEIPDYSDREDEIGDLSASLRAMTGALYERIDAIERFAGDVSHELKNPLTSLRSAVETLPLAKTDESRQRLIDIINHDVRRLNRLISDIADASRLDAELALQEADPVDLRHLLEQLIDINRQIAKDQGIAIELEVEPSRRPFLVFGHDLRIGQVVTNLIENARSFVPDGEGRIRVRLGRNGPHTVVVTVTDNGPGIPEDATERIFERFYTDRPQGEAFGQNSGLGLSISRQIIEAHGGSLTAGNATNGDGAISGAQFRIELPAADGR